MFPIILGWIVASQSAAQTTCSIAASVVSVVHEGTLVAHAAGPLHAPCFADELDLRGRDLAEAASTWVQRTIPHARVVASEHGAFLTDKEAEQWLASFHQIRGANVLAFDLQWTEASRVGLPPLDPVVAGVPEALDRRILAADTPEELLTRAKLANRMAPIDAEAVCDYLIQKRGEWLPSALSCAEEANHVRLVSPSLITRAKLAINLEDQAATTASLAALGVDIRKLQRERRDAWRRHGPYVGLGALGTAMLVGGTTASIVTASQPGFRPEDLVVGATVAGLGIGIDLAAVAFASRRRPGPFSIAREIRASRSEERAQRAHLRDLRDHEATMSRGLAP